jgi:hypothetical protein
VVEFTLAVGIKRAREKDDAKGAPKPGAIPPAPGASPQ